MALIAHTTQYIPDAIEAAGENHCYSGVGSTTVKIFDSSFTNITSTSPFIFDTIQRIYPIGSGKEIFVLTKDANSKSYLLYSGDGGETASEVLRVGLVDGTHYANITGMERSCCEAIIGGVKTYFFAEYNVVSSGVRQVGTGNDTVRVWESTDKVNWNILVKFNQDGTNHNLNHFHGVFYDNNTGFVYLACGDAGVDNRESGIIKWDPSVGVWEDNKNISHFNSIQGFNSIFGSQNYRAVDILITQNRIHWAADSTGNVLSNGFYSANKDLSNVTSSIINDNGEPGGDFIEKAYHFGWTGCVTDKGNIILGDFWQSPASDRKCNVYMSEDEGETYSVVGNVICGKNPTSNYCNYFRFKDYVLISNRSSPLNYTNQLITNILKDNGLAYDKEDYISLPFYDNFTAETYTQDVEEAGGRVVSLPAVSDVIFNAKKEGLSQYITNAISPAFGITEDDSKKITKLISIVKGYSGRRISAISSGASSPSRTISRGSKFNGIGTLLYRDRIASGSVTRADIKASYTAGAAFLDLGSAANIAQYAGQNLLIVLRSKSSPTKCAYGYLGEAGTGETLGAELVANGSFATDITSWTASTNASLSVVSDDHTGDGGKSLWVNRTGSGAMASQTLTVVQRALFKISGWGKSSNGYSISLVRNLGGGDLGASTGTVYNTQWTGMSAYACSVETNPEVRLGSPVITGALAYFDDISVKQVLTPSIYGTAIVNGFGTSTKNWIIPGESGFNYNDPLGYDYEILELTKIGKSGNSAFDEFSAVVLVRGNAQASKTIVGRSGPSLLSWTIGSDSTGQKAEVAISSDGITLKKIQSVSDAMDNDYHVIGLTFNGNGGVCKLGVDGIYESTLTTGVSSILYTTRADLSVGADYSGVAFAPQKFFGGDLYGILTFNKDLTAEELVVVDSLLKSTLRPPSGDHSPVSYQGPPRNNITRLTGESTTIDPAGTYEFADTNAWREVTGWTAGTANDFFAANGLPIPFTGQQLIDSGIGPRLYCGLKKIAAYKENQNAVLDKKIKRITGV